MLSFPFPLSMKPSDAPAGTDHPKAVEARPAIPEPRSDRGVPGAAQAVPWVPHAPKPHPN